MRSFGTEHNDEQRATEGELMNERTINGCQNGVTSKRIGSGTVENQQLKDVAKYKGNEGEVWKTKKSSQPHKTKTKNEYGMI